MNVAMITDQAIRTKTTDQSRANLESGNGRFDSTVWDFVKEGLDGPDGHLQ